jgi:hypothetical protein
MKNVFLECLCKKYSLQRLKYKNYTKSGAGEPAAAGPETQNPAAVDVPPPVGGLERLLDDALAAHEHLEIHCLMTGVDRPSFVSIPIQV